MIAPTPKQVLEAATVRVELDDQEHWIRVDCQYRDRDLVKSIPGRKWDPNDLVWKVPATYNACVQLRAEFGPRLEIGERLWSWADAWAKYFAYLHELREAPDAPDVDAPRLSPLQRAAVKFLSAAGQAAETDPLGGGKTVISINALEHLGDAYPALIVCTKIMKDQWLEHFAEWAPDRRVEVVTGNITKRRKTLKRLADGELDVVIMNWAQLTAHSRVAGYGGLRLTDKEKEPKELNSLPLRTVIADAAQNAANPKSKQTRALWWVGHKQGVKYRWPMTGSIGDDAVLSQWPLLHFVAPSEWPSKTQFVDRYCVKAWNLFGFLEVQGIRPEMRQEFDWLRLARVIRRPKKLLLPDLPDRAAPQVRTVEMSPKQKKAYKQAREESLAEFDGDVLATINPLTKVRRLLQIAQAFGEVETTPGPPGEPAKVDYRMCEPSNKVDAMLDVLDEAGDEPVVFFSESRQLVELCAARLASPKHEIPFAQITGGVSDGDRTAAVRDFQEGRIRALLVVMSAGGEGLTLTRSNIACFLNRPYSRLQNEESEGRLDRWGQDRPLRVIDLVSEGTMEPDVLETLVDKAESFEDMVRDSETLARLLSYVPA